MLFIGTVDCHNGRKPQQPRRSAVATVPFGPFRAPHRWARTDKLIPIRQVRSGAGVLGSIPIAAVAAGVFVVLVFTRFVSLMFTLNSPSETKKYKAKEAPMNKQKWKIALGSLIETAWALAVSVAAGLLLLS